MSSKRSTMARIQALTAVDKSDASVGDLGWWRGRRRAVRDQRTEELGRVTSAVARGGGAIEHEEEIAHRVVHGLKDDLRLARAAYARVQMGRVPRLLEWLEEINARVESWELLASMGPEELLKVKASIQSELASALSLVEKVLDGPVPLASRVQKPKIDESSREEKAKRAVLQAFMLEFDQVLREGAIERGLLESPVVMRDKLAGEAVVEAEAVEVVGGGADHEGGADSASRDSD